MHIKQCQQTSFILGYDYVPILFNHDDNDTLSGGQKLDIPKKKESSGTVSAMAKFRTMDKRAQSADDSESGTGVQTTHQNVFISFSPVFCHVCNQPTTLGSGNSVCTDMIGLNMKYGM